MILAATKEKGRKDPTEIAPRLQQAADEVVTRYIEKFRMKERRFEKGLAVSALCTRRTAVSQ